MKEIRYILSIFLLSIFLLPSFSSAADSVFYFSLKNGSKIILSNDNGDKVGYDGNDIYEEITNSEVFLNGNLQAIKIEDITDGNYEVDLENNNLYEETLLSYFSTHQVLNQKAYFLLKDKNQIQFEVKSGEIILGKNYSLTRKLRLKKQDWKLTWDDDGVQKFAIYGKKPDKQAFEYIGETDQQEFILTGKQKDFEKYAVTKIFSENPRVESGIFPFVLGAIVFVEDADEDGISDEWEDILGTDKNLADSDGDGVDDLDEIEGDSDPLEKPVPKASGKSGLKHKRKKNKSDKSIEILKPKEEGKKDKSEESKGEEVVWEEEKDEKDEKEEKVEKNKVPQKSIKKTEVRLVKFVFDDEEIVEDQAEQKIKHLKKKVEKFKKKFNQEASIVNAGGSRGFVKGFLDFIFKIFRALGVMFINLFNFLINLIW